MQRRRELNELASAVRDFHDAMPVLNEATSASLPETFTADKLVTLCAACTLDTIMHANKSLLSDAQAAKYTFERVTPLQVSSGLALLEDEIPWLLGAGKGSAEHSQNQRDLKKSGASMPVLRGKLTSLGDVCLTIIRKRAAIAKSWRELVPGFAGWERAYKGVWDNEEEYVPEDVLNLVRKFHSLRSQASDKAAIAFANAVIREPIKRTGLADLTADLDALPIPEPEPNKPLATKEPEKRLPIVPSDEPATPPKPVKPVEVPANASAAVADVMRKYKVDSDQAAVVLENSPRQIIPASAGSGKTTTVTRKIERLINEVGEDPSSIKIMAFNKHAAVEIRKRLASQIGMSNAKLVNPQTTHAFCLAHMSQWGSSYKEALSASVGSGKSKVYGTSTWLSGQTSLVRWAWEMTLSLYGEGDSEDDGDSFATSEQKPDMGLNGRSLKMYIDKGKNYGMTITDFLTEDAMPKRNDPRVKRLACGLLLYEKLKGMWGRERQRYGEKFDALVTEFVPEMTGEQKAQWASHEAKATLDGEYPVRFDFTDMLNEFYVGISPQSFDTPMSRGVKKNRIAELQAKYKHWIVDEAQDLAPVQIRMFDAIAANRQEGEGTFTLVGDDAQSIYAFRGASPEDFVKNANSPEYAKRTIATNYRSNEEIVAAADKLVNNNRVQLQKSTRAAAGPGGIIHARTLPDYEAVSNEVADRISLSVQTGGYINERGQPRFAIIMRTNRELNMFEEELALRNIRYFRKSGVPFWGRNDVQGTIGYLACGLAIAGKIKLSQAEQLKFLGAAFSFPRRNGCPSAGGSFFLKPVSSATEPVQELMRMLETKSPTEIMYKGSNVVPSLLQFAEDLRRIADSTKSETNIPAMFDAMMKAKGTGHDGETILQALKYDEAVNDTEDEGAVEEDSMPATFEKLLRFQQHNNFSDPSDLVRQCVNNIIATDKFAEDRDKNSDVTPEAVVLSTVHATKGLEYEEVYTVMNSGTFPSPVFPNDDLFVNVQRLAAYDNMEHMKIEEERRLAYVAVTRAVRKCCVYSTTTNHRGKPTGPSQFISELGLEQEVPKRTEEDVSQGLT